VHALVVHLPGAAPARRELPGPLVAGGSHADDLLLPACPAAALRLVPCAAGVVVEPLVTGVRAAGHAVHPGARRLLRGGERVEVRGAALEVALAAPPEETRVAAAALLRDAAAGTAPPPGLHLVILSGPAAGARHAVVADQTLGRGRAASIVLPDPTASRVHARLTLGPTGASIEDLGSRNGVRVNGVRIDRRPFAIAPGDEVRIGETALALVDGAAVPPGASGSAGRRSARVPLRLLAAALLALAAAALAVAAG
jgi:ribosome-associated protein YbcJ (S4-like RNA binding protein)